MTPKEKAEDLIKQYKPIVTLKMGFEHAYILKQAKKAALIAVNEILKAVNDPDDTFLSKDGVDYWEEVKKEINGE